MTAANNPRKWDAFFLLLFYACLLSPFQIWKKELIVFHSCSSLSVHLWCCFLLNRKVKYFNMKGSFSDPHTIRGLTKAGEEVSCCAKFCSIFHLKHFRSSCAGFLVSCELHCTFATCFRYSVTGFLGRWLASSKNLPPLKYLNSRPYRQNSLAVMPVLCPKQKLVLESCCLCATVAFK